MGFQSIDVDRCVFRKVQAGRETWIGIYVDDLAIFGDSEAEVDSAISGLKRAYPDIAVHRGRTLNYVGMLFDHSTAGVCRVTMPNFVRELLDEVSDIRGTSGTPATATLFEVSGSADHGVMLPEERRKRFHSLVAKLLYLAKRCRPDLLTSVAFLTTRVLAATAADWDKLTRVVRYIRGTASMGIVLRADLPIRVHAYVDASYAVHADMRSHTGALITLGAGPVFASSSRQRLNTKSSTEAELVALSDALGQIIWTRNFLLGLGLNTPAVRVAQDNEATIALVRNGRSNSSRTRHIATRYFFVADRVATGEVQVYHLRTEDMIADILTKPMAIALFRALRAGLLNWNEESA
jgi:hypothetical protein